jgi:hypothetical protein
MGEASLLMAKALNEKATPYNRPESDLKVTYLVFPGTGEKPWGPPDLKLWEQKVVSYLNEIGGIGAGYTLHQWPEPFPPPPPPPAAVEPIAGVAPAAGAATGATPPVEIPGTPAAAPAPPPPPSATPSGGSPP